MFTSLAIQGTIHEKRDADRLRMDSTSLAIQYSDGSGVYRTMVALLVNVDSHGLGVNTAEPLHQHSEVTICMKWDGALVQQRSSVRWCRPTPSGRYRIGLRLLGVPVLIGEECK